MIIRRTAQSIWRIYALCSTPKILRQSGTVPSKNPTVTAMDGLPTLGFGRLPFRYVISQKKNSQKNTKEGKNEYGRKTIQCL